jgi:hypothetical protein
MAKNLMKIKGKIAFLCGNVHASKNPIKLPTKNNIIKTCGSFLPKQKTIAYKIIPVNGGKFYNFKTKKIKPDKRFQDLKNLPKILKSPEKGFDYFYLVNKFTPSK